jgi:hypothetical protein
VMIALAADQQQLYLLLFLPLSFSVKQPGRSR